ncbi:MAG: ABC transporter ATP-binding protein [Proteobacteria bacterium]|nr:ABC transporter ATP-binding protein [Pseudomonadota bacterium]
MNDTVIEVKNLRKIFLSPSGEDLEILKNINFSLKAGHTCSIVGASGAGKTTFLHILGLLDSPTGGEILYFGSDVSLFSSDEKADFRNKNIGFVFQMHYLLPEFTALENAIMPLLIRGVSIKEAYTQALELFETVSLTHRLNHKPGQLSGGEQQRVALIRAFITKPKVILADEPTGNLDKKNAMIVTELFLKLNKIYNTSIILVTHNDELAGMMQEKYKIDDGVLMTI